MSNSIYDADDVIEYILADLDKKVKRDRPSKISAICGAVSAYIPKCPLNIFFKGQSSIGKTYIILNVVSYFPQCDVRCLGGLSPKALVRDHGIRLNIEGKEIKPEDKPKKPLKKRFKDEKDYEETIKKWEDEMKEWNKEWAKSYILIDLNNTIMVFIDAPEKETLNILKPILSHDKEEIEFKFADKTPDGSWKTAKVVVRGAPATFFCSTDKKYVEEQSTRGSTITPEISEEKIQEAKKVIAESYAYPWKDDKPTEEAKQITKFLWEMREAFVTHGYRVVIPFIGWEDLYPSEVPRDMRDFTHLNQFVSSIAALHIHKRVIAQINGKKYVLASASDLIKAIKVFNSIFETTRTGTESIVFDFYYGCVCGNYHMSVNQLTEAWNNHVKGGRKRGSSTVRNWVERLCLINYMQEVDNPDSKKTKLYAPLVSKKPEMFENSLNSGIQIFSLANVKKAFESWRKKCYNQVQFYKAKKNTGEDIKVVKITEEEAEKTICNI